MENERKIYHRGSADREEWRVVLLRRTRLRNTVLPGRTDSVCGSEYPQKLICFKDGRGKVHPGGGSLVPNSLNGWIGVGGELVDS